MTREEAIKEAYGIPVTKAQHEALQFLIPELAENDDERIKRALCDIVRDMPYMETELRAHGLTVEKTLAYLEKQKEPSELEQLEKLREMTHEIRKAYERGIEVGRAEPKPAWSEEDERILTSIIARGSLQVPFGEPALREEQMDWLMNMLKFHRPQPKQEWSEEDIKKIRSEEYTKGFNDAAFGGKLKEWSEEDERMLSRCVKSIESSKNFADSQTFKDAKDKEKEWLISLPERFNLQDVREQYPIEDCDYGLEIALDILVKTLNKVQGYQTDDGIREHQTAIQAVKDAMKPWSYPYGKNETVDKLIGIAECLEMDGDCMFNGISGDDCGKFLRDLARKQTE